MPLLLALQNLSRSDTEEGEEGRETVGRASQAASCPHASALALLNSSEVWSRVGWGLFPSSQKEETPRRHSDSRCSSLEEKQDEEEEVQGRDVRCWMAAESGPLLILCCVGPTPLDCSRQLHAALGLPFLPPLAALGVHQSRWSYSTQVRRCCAWLCKAGSRPAKSSKETLSSPEWHAFPHRKKWRPSWRALTWRVCR